MRAFGHALGTALMLTVIDSLAKGQYLIAAVVMVNVLWLDYEMRSIA